MALPVFPVIFIYLTPPYASVGVRFSPTGSVVVLTERQRAKSESPSRADELRQPSSQVQTAGSCMHPQFLKPQSHALRCLWMDVESSCQS